MANETFGGPFPSYVASKQSVDFPAMVAGTATAQVTVEGVSPGDLVLVSKPDTAVVGDALSLSGYCDTADLVDVIVTSNSEIATTNLGAVTLTIAFFPA
jgi:hypothetical protein